MIVALITGDNDPPFRISNGLAKEIGDEFGFRLTRREIARLEKASRQTIHWRRLVLSRKAHEREEADRAAAIKGQKKIAVIVADLIDQLETDEREGDSWSLRSKNARWRGFHSFNVLRKPIPHFDDVFSMLRVLKRLASEPGPPQYVPKVSKRGRPKNVEGWGLLYVAAAQIFRERGKLPTAYYRGRGRYTSRFLRGLEKLNIAFPADVQVPASALGSPTAKWTRESNKGHAAYARQAKIAGR